MQFVAAVAAATFVTAMFFFVIRLDLKFRAIKARGLAATDAEIQAMSITELQSIRDLLEPGIHQASEQAQAQFRKIDQSYKEKRENRFIPRHRPEDH